jgi:hypothetical protein
LDTILQNDLAAYIEAFGAMLQNDLAEPFFVCTAFLASPLTAAIPAFLQLGRL